MSGATSRERHEPTPKQRPRVDVKALSIRWSSSEAPHPPPGHRSERYHDHAPYFGHATAPAGLSHGKIRKCANSLRPIEAKNVHASYRPVGRLRRIWTGAVSVAPAPR